MKTHLISLAYVRMALQRTKGLTTTRVMAVSREHAPMVGRGREMLHGACVIFPVA